MAKVRKHSGRKRPNGEIMKLNLKKFEKMVAISGDRGMDVHQHIDPRYYPTIIPHKPIQLDAGKKPSKRSNPGKSPSEQYEADQERKESVAAE